MRCAGSNQAVNFTAYTEFKEILQRWQPEHATSPLPSYQTTLIGLVSGAMGPLSNAPIDTIKTRLQKTPGLPGETALSRITAIARDMFKSVLFLFRARAGRNWGERERRRARKQSRRNGSRSWADRE